MSRPDRATFRLPAPALFFPVLLFVCIVPLATAGGAWGVMFVVPVLALVWVLVTRTKATPSRVTAYGLLGARRMAWTEMDGLELKESQWAIAVGTDGRRLRLPMVRPRDLPRLAAVSGGSLLFGDDALATQQAADPDILADPAEGVDRMADLGAADGASDTEVVPVARDAAVVRSDATGSEDGDHRSTVVSSDSVAPDASGQAHFEREDHRPSEPAPAGDARP